MKGFKIIGKECMEIKLLFKRNNKFKSKRKKDFQHGLEISLKVNQSNKKESDLKVKKRLTKINRNKYKQRNN